MPNHEPAREKAIEAMCLVLCNSGKFETGQGTCAPTCMDQLGDVRKGSCSHVVEVFGDLVSKQVTAYESTSAPVVEIGEIRKRALSDTGD